MTDQPQIDNLQIPSIGEVAPKESNFSPLEIKKPGAKSASTPLDLRNMSAKEGDENERLINALMQNIQTDKPTPPIDKKPEPTIKEPLKQNISEKRGALTPFVNGFNGLINGIWNAFRSLIPMKR